MLLKIIFMAILMLVSVAVHRGEAKMIRCKGNLRGVITKFSSLSPREIKLLRTGMKEHEHI